MLWATTVAADHVANSALANSGAVVTTLTSVSFKAAAQPKRHIAPAEVMQNIKQPIDILYEMSWTVVSPIVAEALDAAETIAELTLNTRPSACQDIPSSPAISATSALGVLRTVAADSSSRNVSLLGDGAIQQHAIRSLLLSARQEHPGLALHLPGKCCSLHFHSHSDHGPMSRRVKASHTLIYDANFLPSLYLQ